MANIRLAVSCLQPYEQLVTDTMPHVVSAFAPFGINLQLQRGVVLNQDPAYIPGGWSQLINQLSQISHQTNPPSPAHVVVTLVPPGFDRSINGQLLLRERGICAVFLGAQSFQTPNPQGRRDLIIQVLMHEVGHVMDLTHGDDFAAGYASAMMPTEDRMHQSPDVAWIAATQDAASRGEAPIPTPSPTLYYPFGAQCRACLRQAAVDSRWWPWLSPFRGNFDEPSQNQDQSLNVSFVSNGLNTDTDDGLAFTLALDNKTSAPIRFPTHLGPEFGTLRVLITDPTGEQHLFRATNLRCSSARQAVMPAERVLRSFVLLPEPGVPVFHRGGPHTVRVSVLSSHDMHPMTLGTAEIVVDVASKRKGRATRAVASELVASLRGLSAAPEAGMVRRILADKTASLVIRHARYKHAAGSADSQSRIRTLTAFLVEDAPVAVRHRAARKLIEEMLGAGASSDEAEALLRTHFAGPEHAELFETLHRMRDGWNNLPLT